jgi:broad specificity phosphatase PhoE
MTGRLTLICHGSTDAARAAKFPADEPLDDLGKTHAAAIAGLLPKADHYWTSPELRTRQTAQALELNAVIQPTLRDCDYGAWTGLSFDEVRAREPDALSAWLDDPATTPHGGESIAAVIRRVRE